MPYLGATNNNNGVMKFVKRNDKLQTKGNCVVFICDGQGSVGYSIYKREDFIGSTTLKVGYSKNINLYTGLFLTAALDQNRALYSFGYKRNENRLKNETILLPIDDNDAPDYGYMEQYIKNKIHEKYSKYLDFITD